MNLMRKQRYQFDNILANQRYGSSVKILFSYPGADANTDHNIVMIKVILRL